MGAAGATVIRVLGTLDVELDGSNVRIDGPRRRALVALLVAQRGTPRNADWIATHLWDDHDRPADATMTVRVYISRLRRMLPQLISTEANGYALAASVQLDTELAAALSAEATTRCRQGDPAAAIDALCVAAALWRGRSFAEFADIELLAMAGETLDRLRANIGVVLADLVDVVESGHLRRDVATALQRIVADDPHREDVAMRLALLHARLGATSLALRTIDRLEHSVGLTDDAVDLREAIVADDLPTVLTWQRYILSTIPSKVTPLTAPWGRPVSPREDRQLLGRERDLAGIHQWIAASRTGVRLALVVGPPGIGKSEFIAHVAAQQPGLHWAAGQHEADLPVPLLGLRRAFPTLFDGLPSLEEIPPTQHPSSSAVIDAAADLITTTVGDRPTGLILEDIHDADSITLHILRRLLHTARDSPLFVVASIREEGRFVPAIRALADKARRSARLVEITLAGLGLDDCAEILTATRPSLLTHAPAVLEATAGNPFFTHLLADSLAATPDDDASSIRTAITSVSNAVGDLFEPQLLRLDHLERHTLELAATIGRQASLPLVQAASPHPADVTRAVVDRLRTTPLLLPERSDADAVAFPHELSRQYVIDAMPPSERRMAHHRVATAMEANPAYAASPREIALHWAHSDERSRSVPHFAAAATEALSVGAFAEALSAADDGLAWCTTDLPGPAYDLHHAATAALVGLGHLALATDRAHTTLAWARLTGDEAAVTRAVALAGGPYLPNAYDGAPSEVVTQVLQDVREPRHRSLLLSQLVLLERSADPRCPAWATEAMALAELCGDVPARLAAAHAGLTVRYGTPAAAERLALAESFAALADEHERRAEHFTLTLDAIGAACELGEFSVAARLVADCRGGSVLRPLDRWWLLSQEGTLASAAGDLDAAEELARQGRTLGEEIGVHDAAAWYFAQMWSLQRRRGHAGELLRVFSRQTPEMHPSWRAMAAAEMAATGDCTGAGHLLDELAGPLSALPSNYLYLGTLAAVLIAAKATGHALAPICQERLAPFREMHAIYGAGCAYLAPVHDLLA